MRVVAELDHEFLHVVLLTMCMAVWFDDEEYVSSGAVVALHHYRSVIAK
jgi:hypothetical protein